jgi:molybdopterin molybdotransferase
MALGGRPGLLPPLHPARLGAALAENDRRADFLRATLRRDEQGQRIATAFPAQDSSMLKTMARADALILRAPMAPAAETGSVVDILVLDELGL